MTHGSRWWAALAACVILAHPAPAVAGPEGRAAQADEAPMTLAEAARLARENSLAVLSGRQQLKAAGYDRGVTRAQGLPSVSLTSSVNYNYLPIQVGPLSSLTFFPANGLYAQSQVSGSWTVFDAFASHDALLISDKTIQSTELGVVASEQDAMAQAAQTYFDVLKAEGLVAMNEAAVKRAQDQAQLGERRFKQDLITRGDLLQLKSQLGNALNAYAQAQNNVAIARLNFANALNIPVGDRPLVPNPSLPAVPTVTERQFTDLVSLRADVVQAAIREEIDQTRVSLQGKASYPTVALTANYSQRNLDNGQFSSAMQMSWNVFDGFKVRNQVESAMSQAEASHTAYVQARQRALLDLRQASQTYANAQAQVANAKATLASAREAYRLGRRRYELDLVTQFALSDVEATLRQAEYNMVTAVNDARVAQVKLARAMGYDLAKLLIGP